MKLGNKIIKLRKDNKLSQEVLADKIGVSRQTISNWELNITKPDASHIKKMSKIFNISIDELLDNDIRDIMEKKISDTEKNTNKNRKNIKILLITIYFIILALLIWVIVYYSTKKDFTNMYQNVWVCSLEYTVGKEMITDTYYLHWTGIEDGTFSAVIEFSTTTPTVYGDDCKICFPVYSDDCKTCFYGDTVVDYVNFGSNFSDMITFLEHAKNNLIYRGAVCR